MPETLEARMDQVERQNIRIETTLVAARTASGA
jgi:hypothetical protein